MQEITKNIQSLIEVFSRSDEWNARADEDRIKVGELSSKLVSIYERIRNAVEYHEEHLLRRNAIARILKRRFVRGVTGEEIARPLVEELIRARYLPNDKLPERIIEDIQIIIDKHITLINTASVDKRSKAKRQIFQWILGIMASELEEFLIPHHRERALVDAMFRLAQKEMIFLDERLPEKERDIQIYLAVHRSLLKADFIWLRYQLLKLYYPDWATNDPDTIREVAGRFSALKNDIEKTLKHRLAPYLARHLQPYSVLFWILKDILEKEPKRAEKILSNPNIFNDFIKEACSSRYQKSYIVLRRSAVRAVIFIFFTKIILAFILEVPFDYYVEGSIDWRPLAINVFFHPLLMMLIAATTRVPSQKNTERITEGMYWLVYGKGQEKIIFKPVKIPGVTTVKGLMINTLYAVMYLITFGIIFWGLNSLGFNIVNGLLFVLFLSLISFFGIRIRQSARELNVLRKKENVISILFDFFTLPIVHAGRWISLKSSKINIFVFILDFIIEAPYKMIVEVFDDLVSFIREKKEEIY